MKKAILITGSTDGIGKLVAIKLAKDGHQVFLHGRNGEKLTKVIAEVKELSNNENIDGFVADFSDLKAVKNMVSNIKENIPKLDILINNAGVFKSSINQTGIGLDIRFAVNYFAPYILTEGLIPLLQKGARILNLSSAAQSTVSHDALIGKEQISSQEAYTQSKLALTMWSFDLAELHSEFNIIAVNPGSLLNTNMVREAYGRFWSTADKGGDILYDLAQSEKYKDMTGVYFDNDKGSFGRANPEAYDKVKVKNLISFTNEFISNLD